MMVGTRPRLFGRSAISGYGLALASIAAIGVALRFYSLGAHYLSYDESFTVLMVGRPLPDLIRAAAGDVHPPLSYLMYWVFVRLAGGTTPLTLRLPAAVLGSLAIWQVYGLMRRLSFSRPALLAGLALFALSPFEIHYSQDARMYGLLQLAVLGAVLAMLDRRYWLMGAWMAVAAWSHNYGLFYVAVIGAAAFVRELGRPVIAAADPVLGWVGPQDSARPRDVLLACGLAIVSFVPWAGVLVQQIHTLGSGYWMVPLSLGQFIYPIFPLVWGVALPEALNGLGAAVAIGLVLFAMLKAFKLKRYRLLVWLMVAPALLAAGVSLVSTPIYLYRALIGCVPPMLLLIGWAIADGTGLRERAWAAAVIAPLLLLAIWNRLPSLQAQTAENSWALRTVLAGYQTGDIVFHGNVGTLSGFEATGPAWLPNYLMTVQPGSVGVLTPQTRAALGFCEGDLEPVLRVNCGGGHPLARTWRRAWLVWGASQTISGTEDQAIAALLVHYPNVKELDIHDVYHGPMPVDGGIWLLTNGVQ
jgi:Dolichyl-phosphate-mannose-protein mannosyltransferase